MKEFEYAEPQHHMTKNSFITINIDDTVIVNLINLQFNKDVSADTVKALQLMSTHTLMSDEITAYISMSIKQLKCVIYTEQSNNNLIQ